MEERTKKSKKSIHWNISSVNKKTGALIKWHSKEIKAKMSISLSTDTEGYGSLLYYGTHIGGNRAYKIISLNPKRVSAASKIKAIAKTNTLRLDGWSVAFYKENVYLSIVDVLRSRGFFKVQDTFVGKTRTIQIPHRSPK